MRGVRRTVRKFLSPRWLALHGVVLASSVAMVLLGRWQLDVSNSKDFSLQNFGYALQWWTFTVFLIFFWLRLMRDAQRPPLPDPASGQLMTRGVQGLPAARGMGGGLVEIIGSAKADSTVDSHVERPVAYIGYLMPDSATTPARSEGDSYHAAYNDYLWQLNLRDAPPSQAPQQPDSSDRHDYRHCEVDDPPTMRAIEYGPEEPSSEA